MSEASHAVDIDTVEDLQSAVSMFSEYTHVLSENGKPLTLRYAPNYTADGSAALIISETHEVGMREEPAGARIANLENMLIVLVKEVEQMLPPDSANLVHRHAQTFAELREILTHDTNG